jgi:hypothetical protein
MDVHAKINEINNLLTKISKMLVIIENGNNRNVREEKIKDYRCINSGYVCYSINYDMKKLKKYQNNIDNFKDYCTKIYNLREELLNYHINLKIIATNKSIVYEAMPNQQKYQYYQSFEIVIDDNPDNLVIGNNQISCVCPKTDDIQVIIPRSVYYDIEPKDVTCVLGLFRWELQ